MKRCTPLLICFLAISGASAGSPDSRLPVHGLALSAGGLPADVVRDVRATSAFVRDQARAAVPPSRWLVALAACGLITMQLRRKHKSLPQRRIAPYG